MISDKIDISDFDFELRSHGIYKVTFTSRKTGKTWSSIISEMSIIDATKNTEEPKVKNLIRLKELCKLERFI